MEQFVLWYGFLGAWLLFAGPILQATLEMREQELSREEFESAHASVEREPPVSAWWWLLPPVYYWLNHRRSNRMNKAMMKLLNPQQLSGYIDNVNHATGVADDRLRRGGGSQIWFRDIPARVEDVRTSALSGCCHRDLAIRLDAVIGRHGHSYRCPSSKRSLDGARPRQVDRSTRMGSGRVDRPARAGRGIQTNRSAIVIV